MRPAASASFRHVREVRIIHFLCRLPGTVPPRPSRRQPNAFMPQPRLPRKPRDPIRLGAVSYLNARPLIHTLARRLPQAEITVDFPSRLADALAAGRLDAAMIPSIEYARGSGYSILSDACIACDGPVRSVKLYGRVPVERIRTLALDEGSRTSAALARILLQERFGISPAIESLPLGNAFDDAAADAVLLIGDRGLSPNGDRYAFVWDLGEEWIHWTGLPFVFSLWIARPGMELPGVAEALAAARADGLDRLDDIARLAAPEIGIPCADCLTYLRDNLRFHLGTRQRRSLELFFALAARHQLAPDGVRIVFHGQ